MNKKIIVFSLLAVILVGLFVFTDAGNLFQGRLGNKQLRSADSSLTEKRETREKELREERIRNILKRNCLAWRQECREGYDAQCQIYDQICEHITDCKGGACYAETLEENEIMPGEEDTRGGSPMVGNDAGSFGVNSLCPKLHLACRLSQDKELCKETKRLCPLERDPVQPKRK